MQSDHKTDASRPKGGRKKRFLLWFVFGALLLVVLILTAAPRIMEWYVKQILAEAGAVHARVENIDFNPFSAVIRIEALQAFPEDEDEVLRIAEAVIKYDWQPLWHHRFYIEHLTINKVALDIERRKDGGLTIGRLQLPLHEQKNKKSNPWEIGFGSLDLDNIKLFYRDPAMQAPILIKKAEISNLASWDRDKAGTISLQMTVNDHPLEFSGTVSPFAASPSLKGKIDLDRFGLSLLTPMVQSLGVKTLNGSISVNSQIDIEIVAEHTITVLLKGKIEIADANIRDLDDNRLVLSSAAWQGPIRLRFGEGPAYVDTGGSSVAADEDNGEEKPSGGTLQVKGLGIHADGLTAEKVEFAWQGPFSYRAAQAAPVFSAEGDFRASCPECTFEVADGRLAGEVRTEISVRVEEREKGIAATLKGPFTVSSLTGELTDLQLQLQRLGWNGELNGLYQNSRMELSGNGEVTADDSAAALLKQKMLLTNEKVKSSAVFSLVSQDDKPLELRIEAEGSGANLRLSDSGNQYAIASVGEYALSGGSFSFPDSLQGEGLVLRGLKALERRIAQEDRGTNEPQYTGTLAEIILDKMSLKLADPLRLSIATARMRQLQTWIERTAEGKLEIMNNERYDRIFGPEEEVQGQAAEEKQGMLFAIGRIAAQGENLFSFHDHSVSPDFDGLLSPFTLTVDDLTNADTTAKARLALDGSLGRYGKLAVNGTARPFGEAIDMDLEIDIREYDLTRLSPYIRQNTGYTVASGQLRADISWVVKADRLDGLFDLLLIKPDLQKVAASDKEPATGNPGMPLNQGLNLMRDKQGSIALSIPVSGDLNDPHFHFHEIFWSAFAKTLQKSAVSYFAPIGVAALTGASLPVGALWAAGKLFSKMTALRFEPLLFEPLHSEITPEQQVRLDKLVDLLNDRPETELVICGIADQSDLAALRRMQRQSDRPSSAAAAAAVAPDEGELADLHSLAARRSQSVKGYLVNRGIPSSRLITCNPEYSVDKNAKPSVEIGI